MKNKNLMRFLVKLAIYLPIVWFAFYIFTVICGCFNLFGDCTQSKFCLVFYLILALLTSLIVAWQVKCCFFKKKDKS